MYDETVRCPRCGDQLAPYQDTDGALMWERVRCDRAWYDDDFQEMLRAVRASGRSTRSS